MTNIRTLRLPALALSMQLIVLTGPMKRAVVPVLLAGTVVAAGCVADTRPDSELCGQSAIEVQVSLSAETMEPSSSAVCRDQRVTLVVDSEVAGVVHIHGYDGEVPAFEVRAGQETIMNFTAGRSGQFPIEVHAGDDPRGVEVGILTVHEP